MHGAQKWTTARSPKCTKASSAFTSTTARCQKIVQETNSLTYRGYAVQDLAANCKFEEVAYLMWNGELPTKQQLADFEKEERSLRKIDDNLVDVLKKLRTDAHPMDVLRTAISFIGAQDPNWADESKEANLEECR